MPIKELSGMNGTNILFDTCAVVKLLDKQYDLALLGINVDEARLLTSVIVRMELLAKRDMAEDEEQAIREFLDDLIVAPLDAAVEQTATAIRRATSVKLPDCIVAATSIVLNAVLLTDDDQLLHLAWPGLRAVNIL